MELSEAKDILQNIIADEVIGTYCLEIQKTVNCEENCKNSDCYLYQAIDTVLKALDNSISKDELQKTFTKHTEEYHKYLDGMERKLSHLKDDHKIRATYAEFGVLKGKVEVLKELLGEE